MPGYSFADVLKHTGVEQNQLKRWTDVNVIEAASGDGSGTGHHRRFSLVNLVEVAVAKELAAFRIATPKLRELIAVVPLGVEWGLTRLWIDSDGKLSSIGGGDPFVKKERGLVGIALDAIIKHIERSTGESFPETKELTKTSASEFSRKFLTLQRKRLRR